MKLRDEGTLISTRERVRLLSVARRVAGSCARALAAARSAAAGKVDSAHGRDIKLAADRDSERRAIRMLRLATDIPILSEETGTVGRMRKDGLRWILDPLDGSFNYHRGLPGCAVSLALWREMEPLLGVVQDLGSGEAFSGAIGEGAWVGQRPMCVSDVNSLRSSALCTGLPVRADYSGASLRAKMSLFRRVKKVRMLGSASLMLAYVACGRADAYVEEGIRLWDVAAGLALLLAAGGMVRMRCARGEDSFFVVGTNGRIRLPLSSTDGCD